MENAHWISKEKFNCMQQTEKLFRLNCRLRHNYYQYICIASHLREKLTGEVRSSDHPAKQFMCHAYLRI